MRYSIIALLLLISEADARQEWSKWNSPEECFSAHLRLAEGRYPLPHDDTMLLKYHCEYEYKARKCNFVCEVPRVGWEFAIFAPRDKREARLRMYFRSAQRKRTSCDIITRVTDGCPKEHWTIP